MKKWKWILPLLTGAALLLAACGGKRQTDSAATTAAAEATSAAAEAAPETEAAGAEDSPTAKAAKEKLSKEAFIGLFDLLLEDAEDPDAFEVSYKDKTYHYAELGDLYNALAEDGGKGTVNLMGESEEELDFEEIAQMMAMQNGFEAEGSGSGSGSGSDGSEDAGDSAEDEGSSDESALLSKAQFLEYFDWLIQDKGTDRDSFYVEYDGKTYRYGDLGDLYDAAAAEDGCIDVSIMGDELEMLDFEIIANRLEFNSGLSSWDDSSVDQALIDRFYGDWHGVCMFKDCTGKYVDALGEGEWVTSIARIYIDSDGYVIPFIGLHVEETPLEGLEGELDTKDECIYLSGSWISVPFEQIPLTEKNGTLHCEIPISKEAGSVTLVFNLRHLNDTDWAGEDPRLPEDYIVNCQGWSFDKLAESNGYTSWDYVSYSADEEPEYPTQIAPEVAEEDFGKTTEDADGVVSRSRLQEGYNKVMDELDRPGHDPVTYEFVRDAFGTDGKKDMPAQWNEGTHIYEWQTEGEADWVSIIFQVYTDGSERLHTVNQSEAILNGR